MNEEKIWFYRKKMSFMRRKSFSCREEMIMKFVFMKRKFSWCSEMCFSYKKILFIAKKTRNFSTKMVHISIESFILPLEIHVLSESSHNDDKKKVVDIHCKPFKTRWVEAFQRICPLWWTNFFSNKVRLCNVKRSLRLSFSHFWCVTVCVYVWLFVCATGSI